MDYGVKKMGIKLKSIKVTAFKLEEKVTAADKYFPGLVPPTVIIESNNNYATAGYTIETDNFLNSQTLIVKVTDVKKPTGTVIQMPGKAKGIAFFYKKGKNLDYDSSKMLLTVPKGTTLDVILKDVHILVGAEDLYELTL